MTDVAVWAEPHTATSITNSTAAAGEKKPFCPATNHCHKYGCHMLLKEDVAFNDLVSNYFNVSSYLPAKGQTIFCLLFLVKHNLNFLYFLKANIANTKKGLFSSLTYHHSFKIR